ncbi:MAG: polysaccharide biosynthesis tyrosine autokinase [Gaiellaceae bacterium]
MTFGDYLGVVRRWKLLILGTILAAIGTALLVTYLTPSRYESTATLRVSTPASLSTGSVGFDDVVFLDRLQNTYVRLGRSDETSASVKASLGLASDPDIDVDALPNTELLEVTARASDPAVAASIANALADTLLSEVGALDARTSAGAAELFNARVDELEAASRSLRTELAALDVEDVATATQRAQLEQRLEVTQDVLRRERVQYELDRAARDGRTTGAIVARPAQPPRDRSTPRPVLNILLGAVAGLIGGLGLAFLFEGRYRRIDRRDDIYDATETHVLAEIPRLRWHGFPGSQSREAAHAEAFQRLNTMLHAVPGLAECQVLLLTSAEPREGKSTIAANLAEAMAQSGRSVLLVDADLRRPTLHELFALSNNVGLTSVLRQGVPLDDALQADDGSNLCVLTSGPADVLPAALLASGRMSDMLHEARSKFDRVIVDSPAILAVGDAVGLVPIVDGLLLVVGQGQVGPDALKAARAELEGLGVIPAGVIINRTELAGSHAYYAAARA